MLNTFNAVLSLLEAHGVLFRCLSLFSWYELQQLLARIYMNLCRR